MAGTGCGESSCSYGLMAGCTIHWIASVALLPVQVPEAPLGLVDSSTALTLCGYLSLPKDTLVLLILLHCSHPVSPRSRVRAGSRSRLRMIKIDVHAWLYACTTH